jgi:hypothetical protein
MKTKRNYISDRKKRPYSYHEDKKERKKWPYSYHEDIKYTIFRIEKRTVSLP